MTDLVLKQAYLAGFVNPVGFTPAFFEPVFVKVPNGNEYFLQECDENGRIVRFVPGVEDDEEVLRVEPARRKRVGQAAIYAFCPGPDEGNVLADERPALANRLIEDISLYAEYPGLVLEMTEFCGLMQGVSKARLDAYRKIEENISADAAQAWRDTQIFLPLIQSLIRATLVKRMSFKAKTNLPIPLVKMNSSAPSILSVQIPRTIRKLLSSEKTNRQHILGPHVKAAMMDFGIRYIKITSQDRYDRLIDKYIEDRNASDAIALEVVDADLAAKIIEGADQCFSLESSGIIEGFGEKVARIQSSGDILRPAIQIFADKSLPLDLRSKVEERICEWMNAHVENFLGPLLDLEKETRSFTPPTTKVVSGLINSMGVLERRRFAADVKLIDQEERSKLRALGIRFGNFHIYFFSLLKPSIRKLAAQLYLAKAGPIDDGLLQLLLTLGLTGRTAIPVQHGVAPSLYRAIGYAPVGSHALRVDILERLADLIRACLLWNEKSGIEKPQGAVDGKHFRISLQMTSLVGINAATLSEVLRSLGYRKAGQIVGQSVPSVDTSPTHDEREHLARNELWILARSEDRRILIETRSEKISRLNARGSRPRR